ncbi:MAG: nuclear transport factor 2 family protein [Novosphingobium sp.]
MNDPEWRAIEAIKSLKSRYFRFLDTKNYDGLDAIFMDDAVIDVRGSTTASDGGDPTVAGLDDEVMTGRQFKQFFRTGIGHLVTAHHGHMPEITLETADTARAIWAFEDHIWFPQGSPFHKMHGWGHYHDHYVRTDIGWQVSVMKITRIRTETLPW